MNSNLRPQVWEKFPLDQLNPAEWEALCDGCGLCCLLKLEDEETEEVAYTKVSCKLLDCESARCTDYDDRMTHVPDCIQLTFEKLQNIYWLPPSCAYRRINEGKHLPSWHYLNTGTRETVIKVKKSAAGRCISELEIDAEQIEDYIVRWVR